LQPACHISSLVSSENTTLRESTPSASKYARQNGAVE
jgi:hypothetical protein